MEGCSVKADAVLIGEIGLAGELRMPGQMQARLREAQKLGFKTAIVPKALRKGEPYPAGIEIIEVRAIQQALMLHLRFQRNLQKSGSRRSTCHCEEGFCPTTLAPICLENRALGAVQVSNPRQLGDCFGLSPSQ